MFGDLLTPADVSGIADERKVFCNAFWFLCQPSISVCGPGQSQVPFPLSPASFGAEQGNIFQS